MTFRHDDVVDPHQGALDDAGTWSFDDDGALVSRPASFRVSIALPAGEMPARGWPVALFGHGLGGSRAQMLAFVDTLARAGFATVAIDADGHGSRYRDIDDDNNVAARLGDGFAGEARLRDGFGDVEGLGTAFDLFHGFVHIAAMRDTMRQTIVDWGQVVRALSTGVPALDAVVPGARLDGGTIAYLGESYGGVLGALLAAVEPDVHLYFLDVPGGGILEYAALNSPELSRAVKLFVPSTYGLDRRLDRFDPLIGLGSAVLDAADPLSYAPRVLRDQPQIGDRPLGPRSVVLCEVVGDEVLPNSATEALARALGVAQAVPFHHRVSGLSLVDVSGGVRGNVASAGGASTAVLEQVAPANHGDNWSKITGHRKYLPFDDDAIDFPSLPEPIALDNPVAATHAQLRSLLIDYREAAAGTPPALSPGPPPRRDFDGDGVDDDDERAQGTDPLSPDR